MNVSVVIPVFNDASALPALAARLFGVAAREGWALKLLLVDDGSIEDTWADLVALQLSLAEQPVTLLRLDRNYGQHPATLYGLLQADSDILVTMDADLQHPPEALPALLACLARDGADLVYGTARTGHPWPRRLASRLWRGLATLASDPLAAATSFRAMRRERVDPLREPTPALAGSLDAALLPGASRIAVVSVPHLERRHGHSSYTWASLFALGVRMAWHSASTGRVLLAAASATMAAGALLMALGNSTALASAMLAAAAAMAAAWHHRRRAAGLPGRRPRLRERLP